MRIEFVPQKKQKTPLFWRLFSLQSLVNHSAGPDRPFVLCVCGLVVFGWVMVYSSSALVAESRFGDQFFFLKRQLLWSFMGGIAFLVAVNTPVRFWQKYVKVFYAMAIVSLLLVLAIGPEVSGARRWIRAGGFSFQPSEATKLVLILVVADYLDRRQSRLKEFKKGLMPLLLLVGIPLGLIVIEPDLGTPVLMGSVILSLLILGGARWSHLFLMAAATLPLIAFAVLKVRYRLLRLFAYIDPWSDAKGTGYQLVQSLLALGSGGYLGRGLGESRIKISSLPDCHTDFVFSVLGEELGLVGTLLCASLFLFLCSRGLRIAKAAPDLFSRLLAAGISLTIGYQALINMGVATGLFPTKGMPLPFISFGGSSLLITLFSTGILANLSRELNTGRRVS